MLNLNSNHSLLHNKKTIKSSVLIFAIFLTIIFLNCTLFITFSQTKISSSAAALTIILFFLKQVLLLGFEKIENKHLKKLLTIFFFEQAISFFWIFFINQKTTNLSFGQLLIGYLLLVFISFFIQTIFFYLFVKTNKSYPKPFFYKVIIFVLLLVLENVFRVKYFFIFLGKKAGFPLQLFFLPLFFNLYREKFIPKQSISEKQIKWHYLPTMINFQKNFSNFFAWLQKKQKTSTNKLNVFLTEEGFFQYQISIYSEGPKTLAKMVKSNNLFFLCCYKKTSYSLKQSMLLLKKNHYKWISKKNLCPIYEDAYFSASKKKRYFLKIKFKKIIIKLLPLLCSEFFLFTPFKKIYFADFLILCVKTEAFPNYFQNVLLAYSFFVGWLSKKNIIWVDHLGLRMINFSDKFLE